MSALWIEVEEVRAGAFATAVRLLLCCIYEWFVWMMVKQIGMVVVMLTCGCNRCCCMIGKIGVMWHKVEKRKWKSIVYLVIHVTSEFRCNFKNLYFLNKFILNYLKIFKKIEKFAKKGILHLYYALKWLLF